ncbi:MAG: Cobyrinic acid ac-diamide synthase [Clostridia bacterium 41_269]|nr:MAG: Cobyrinic acid ac-diamide synthase [Clostridia bacterium 41_269]
MGKVISIWSAGGGVGKTAVAIALAENLKKNRKTVLADFKEITPHVHRHFNLPLTDKSDIYEAVLNDQNLEEVMEKHLHRKNGLWIMTGFGLDSFMEFEARHFSAVLDFLRKEFDYVVVDTYGGIFLSSVYSALKHSDVIFAVSTQEAVNIEDTAEMIGFVSSRWVIDKNKFKVIINEMLDKKSAELEFIQKALENEIFFVRQGQKNVVRDVGRIVKTLFCEPQGKRFFLKEVKLGGVN